MQRARRVVVAFGLLWGCAAADAAIPDRASPVDLGPAPEASSRRASASTELLANVPADTPWIVASLEPLPDDVVRRYAQVWDAFADGMQTTIDEIDPSTLDPETLAVLRELDGRLSREGLRQLGFLPDGRFVLYGVGLAPVLRLPLSDPAKVRAMLERIDAADRRSWSRVRSGGIELARAREDGTSIVWGVIDRELVIAAYPSVLEREILPLVTGAQMPTRSLADIDWARTMRRVHGLVPHGVGRIDLARIVDAWVGRGPSLTTATARAWDWQSDGDACDEAVRAAVARAPEIVFGATEMSSRRIAGRWVWSMDAALRSDLAAIAGPIPAPRDEGVAQVAFAFDLDAAADASRRWAADLRAEAPGCSALAWGESWRPPDSLAGLRGGSATLHAPSRRGDDPSYTVALGWNDPARWLRAVIGPGALATWPAGRAVRLERVAPQLASTVEDAFVLRTDRAVALAGGRRARAHARQATRGSRRDDDTIARMRLDLGQLRRAIGRRAVERYLAGLDPVERAMSSAVLDLLGEYEAGVAIGEQGVVADWGLGG